MMYIVLAKKDSFRTFLEVASKEYAIVVYNDYIQEGFESKIVAVNVYYELQNDGKSFDIAH